MDTSVRDPLVGERLDGRYRIDALLARGGMGTVYLGVDTRLDRRVAVKVMHPALAADDAFVTRFISEAHAAARLSHPHVVAVYDQGADSASGAVYLVMEYVEGRTLRDLLDERGALRPREALEILEPVLAGLRAAHSAGLVHRDVKPENVLLADDGPVKVVDFGLARAVSSASGATSGLLIGTVAYLAPEQVQHGHADHADPRSDIYAAGILLFEMLTGAPPYDGTSSLQVAFQHVHEDVPPPSSQVPGLPRAVDGLVVGATRRNPAARYPDVNSLLADVMRVRADLRDTVVGTPVLRPARGARHTSTIDVPPVPARLRRARRRWPLAVLVVLLIAALLSTGAWYLAAGPGSYTSAPALLTMSGAKAESKARSLGFPVTYADAQYSEQVPQDSVIGMEPPAGTRIAKGSTLRLVLSKGKERHEVPDLSGRPMDEARALLAQATLLPGSVVQRYDDQIEQGKVVSSDPAAGALLKRAQAVDVVVSKGPAPVDVPNVVRRPSGEAVDALRQRGLQASVSEEYDDTVPAGSVLRQLPENGQVRPGTTVALVISRGPEAAPVPDVADRNADEAVRMLEDAGFRVQVRGTHLFDRVVSSSPRAGEEAPKGSLVTLTTL